MTEVRFYHLTKKVLDQALPEILEKAIEAGKSVVVRANTEEEVERLNTLLWSWKPDSFLPHGSKKDGNAEDQPIWLTDQDENPNNATILILTGGCTSQKVADYDLCCEILDGRDEDIIAKARERWVLYKNEGFDITYWQQGQSGKWEKKS